MKPKRFVALALVLLLPANAAWSEDFWGHCRVLDTTGDRFFATELFQAKEEYMYLNGEIDRQEVTWGSFDELDGLHLVKVEMDADNFHDQPSIDEVNSSRNNYLKATLTLARNFSDKSVDAIFCYFYDNQQIAEHYRAEAIANGYPIHGNPNDFLETSSTLAGGLSPEVRGDVHGSGAWSAIAFTDEEDGLAWGWVVGAASAGEAKRVAVNECESINRGDCSVEQSTEANCIAIAESEDTIAWVFGDWTSSTSARANREAVNECEQDSGACEITTNTCAE